MFKGKRRRRRRRKRRRKNKKKRKGGNFNTRIGKRRNVEKIRDLIVKQGEKITKLTKERGWLVINGIMATKKEVLLTMGRENSMVDHVLANKEMVEEIQRFEIEERIESGHQPLDLRSTVQESVYWRGD